MMKTALMVLLSISMGSTMCVAQPILGDWKTVDDESGRVRSIVRIEQRSGKIYGKIIKVFLQPGEKPVGVCDKCDPKDPRYGQKTIGMDIITGVKVDRDGRHWTGEILDPENGKVYRAKMWRDGDTLNLRGYWLVFYRTQKWLKNKEANIPKR